MGSEELSYHRSLWETRNTVHRNSERVELRSLSRRAVRSQVQIKDVKSKALIEAEEQFEEDRISVSLVRVGVKKQLQKKQQQIVSRPLRVFLDPCQPQD